MSDDNFFVRMVFIPITHEGLILPNDIICAYLFRFEKGLCGNQHQRINFGKKSSRARVFHLIAYAKLKGLQVLKMRLPFLGQLVYWDSAQLGYLDKPLVTLSVDQSFYNVYNTGMPRVLKNEFTAIADTVTVFAFVGSSSTSISVSNAETIIDLWKSQHSQSIYCFENLTTDHTFNTPVIPDVPTSAPAGPSSYTTANGPGTSEGTEVPAFQLNDELDVAALDGSGLNDHTPVIPVVPTSAPAGPSAYTAANEPGSSEGTEALHINDELDAANMPFDESWLIDPTMVSLLVSMDEIPEKPTDPLAPSVDKITQKFPWDENVFVFDDLESHNSNDQTKEDSSACITPTSDSTKRRRLSIGQSSCQTPSSITTSTGKFDQLINLMTLRFNQLQQGEKLVFTQEEVSEYFQKA